MRIYMLFWLIFWAVFTAGEIQCVVKAIKSDWEAPFKREAIYTVSFLTGVGAVTGWFDIADGK